MKKFLFNNKNKPKFFSYSWSYLYQISSDANQIIVWSIEENKLRYNPIWKRIGYAFLIITISVIIKTFCQYFLGAQETSLDKIFYSLDSLFYLGCFWGSSIMIFMDVNWKKICKYFYDFLYIVLDSEDENSEDKELKNSWKGKGKDKLTDSNVNQKIADKGKIPEQAIEKVLPSASASDSASGKAGLGSNTHIKMSMSTNEKIAHIVKASYLADHIFAEIRGHEHDLWSLEEFLEGQDEILSSKKRDIDIENLDAWGETVLKLALKTQNKTYELYSKCRYEWIQRRVVDLNLPDGNENKLKISNGLEKIRARQAKFSDDVNLIKAKQESAKWKIKSNYVALNAQKNLVDKELNKLDSVILKELKQSDCCTLSCYESSKNLVKKLNDYNQANQDFNTKYNYVKQHLGDIIHKKKS